ncbi:MAG: HAD-IC family P-type ATPase, partial [Armatimonadota bacterium]|nr:HAD-IC family P-type ATPase [Armatimonadota bacterium]
PVLTDVIALTGDGESVLRLAAAVERRSEHALADAVVQACFARGLEPPPVTEFEAVTGRGVRGYVEGRRIRAGSERFLLDEGVEVLEDVRAVLRRLRHEGKTPILVAEDRVLGILAVADTVRPEAAAVVRALRRAGIRRLVLLTGDHREVAEAVAEQLGIDDVRAGMLPEEKAEAVRALTRDGVVVMVGDGVNDAPALASAHVGVAMGAAGTDAAMETADVVLMGDALGRLPYVVSLSRRTRRTIQESLVFAGAVIVGLLVATFGAGLRLAAGVVGHEGSTVIVVFNGLRLLRLRPD